MVSSQTRILGIDIGVTSVGWALMSFARDTDGRLEWNENGQITEAKIIDCGVRIFPATTEGKENAPKNHNRRTARLQRRQIRRKAARREQLRKVLVDAGLLPHFDQSDSSKIFQELGDPYELRDCALSNPLEPYKLGRVIYHLSKRRGFLSNRKSGKEKENSIVYKGIDEIKKELESGQFRTLGQFLHKQEKKRKLFTHRTMYQEEFELIWESQKKFHEILQSDQLKSKIRNIIFFQRPIKSQRNFIGKCLFEPDKKRCDMARQEAQRLRYWQDINNLKLQDPKTLDWRPLTDNERDILAQECEKKKEITFPNVRKLLKLTKETRINLETDGKKFYGNRTAYEMRKAVGKKWDSLNHEEQDRLVEELIRIDNELGLTRRLTEFWKFSDSEVQALKNAWFNLEDGYSRLSLKAIRKLLPLMNQGKRYDEAASEIYGDHRKVFGGEEFQKLSLPPRDLRNPIVYKALCEVRKVVNALIREYGKPDQIRIEMARDLKLTKKQKEKLKKQARLNEKLNEEATSFFQERFGLSADAVSKTDKIKYRLWKESGGLCPYTGKSIPPDALLEGGVVDIEHIIPYSKCFDDSFANKTICDANFNRTIKKNRAPGEIFKKDSPEYNEMLVRIKDLPPSKQRKFKMTEDEINSSKSDWIGRMLSDTRYICREVRGYLRELYPSDADENKYVQVVAGGATSNLRHVWGLNAILADGDVDEKNRWDHRHHAIDAIVVALCDRGLFQFISRLAGRNREMMKRVLAGFPEPWDNFLNDVNNAIQKIIVSHAPTRRIRGELLAKTAYGPTNTDGVYVVRKSLTDITDAQIKNIVDPVIKEIVELRLAEHNGNKKEAFAYPLFHKDGKTVIESVRVFENMSPDSLVGIPDSKGQIYKYYPHAGNHHVDIYEHIDTGERKAILVSRFHANQRNWTPPKQSPEWKKLFSLCRNDYVKFLGNDGELKILRIQKMSIGKPVVIHARPLVDARSDYIAGYVTQLQGGNLKRIVEKLQVDPLGRLTQARD